MSGPDILLVDDEPGIVSALCRLLARNDSLRVEAVTDPREAASILGRSPPKVLLTDYRMPDMDGLELLCHARRTAPDTIRVLLTGQADRRHVVDAINMGRIFRFLDKPWDDRELLAVVGEALAAHDARRAVSALRSDADSAWGIQRGLLPQHPATGEAAFFLTACEHASGDYVDSIDLPDGRTALVIGDVCGHGLGAALFVAAARAVIRTGFADGLDPATIVDRTNRFLCRDMHGGRFLTLFLGVHDPVREELWYLNAGQSPPLVLGDHGAFELPATSVPLGLSAESPRASGVEAPFHAGEMLLAYTDGLIEARDSQGELFGRERVRRIAVDRDPGTTPGTLVTTLHDAVLAFTDGRGTRDDLALLVYRAQAVPELARSRESIRS
jgi:CheY-like chemotaxis protein